VCGPNLKTLTLLQIKICYFRNLFQTWTSPPPTQKNKKSIPSFRSQRLVNVSNIWAQLTKNSFYWRKRLKRATNLQMLMWKVWAAHPCQKTFGSINTPIANRVAFPRQKGCDWEAHTSWRNNSSIQCVIHTNSNTLHVSYVTQRNAKRCVTEASVSTNEYC